MNKELLATLQLIDPDTLTSEQARHILSCLEEFYQIILDQREDIQRLKDEINRLKGEQGKPDIKGNKNGSKDQKRISFLPSYFQSLHYESSFKYEIVAFVPPPKRGTE